MNLYLLLIISITLSLDAFITVFLYAYKKITFIEVIYIPILIGTMHVIFPLIAFYLGSFIKIDNINIYQGMIFILLAIFTFIDSFKSPNKESNITLLNTIILSITVSIDSLFMGLSLAFTNTNIIFVSLIFGIFAFIASITAIIFSQIIKRKVKFNLSYISIIVFLSLGILYILNVF